MAENMTEQSALSATNLLDTSPWHIKPARSGRKESLPNKVISRDKNISENRDNAERHAEIGNHRK
jgi:hypothetical protein